MKLKCSQNLNGSKRQVSRSISPVSFPKSSLEEVSSPFLLDYSDASPVSLRNSFSRSHSASAHSSWVSFLPSLDWLLFLPYPTSRTLLDLSVTPKPRSLETSQSVKFFQVNTPSWLTSGCAPQLNLSVSADAHAPQMLKKLGMHKHQNSSPHSVEFKMLPY